MKQIRDLVRSGSNYRDIINQVAEFVVKIQNIDWEKFKYGKN